MKWNKFIRIGAMIGVWLSLIPLHAQIGTDHIRIILNNRSLFGHTIIVDQEFHGIPQLFGGGSQPEPTRDYTGADFGLVTDVLPGEKLSHFAFNGPWLDDGVSVFRVQEGDVFSWDGIQSGQFEELQASDPFGIPRADQAIDLSTPAYLGFLTPIKSIVNGEPAFGGGRIRGIGWAKLEMGSIAPGQTILQLLDHAMNYGGDSIVVGEGGKEDPEEAEKIPVSRFEDAEVLISTRGGNSHWNIGDFDGDGDVDLLTGHPDGGYQVWIQNEDESFSEFQGERITPGGLHDAVGDLDGDGDLDVWVSMAQDTDGSYTSMVWLNQGNGAFIRLDQTLPAGRPTYLGDVDNDGDLDAVTTVEVHLFQYEFQTWLNDGKGLFQLGSKLSAPCGPHGLPAALGDLNDDGFIDFFYVCGGPAKVAFNQGDGTLLDSGESYVNSDILTMFSGRHLALADMDGDGDLDAVIPNKNFENALWLNNGEGQFQLGQSQLGSWSQYALVGDVDTDGDVDILIDQTQGRKTGLQIYSNEGRDLFFKGNMVSRVGAENSPRLIDFDSDGDLDLLSISGRRVLLHRNTIEYITPAPPEDAVDIVDEGLRRGFLEALGKKLTDHVTEEDLLGLKELNLGRGVRGAGAPMIQDFTGLEKAANLESLDLSGGASLGIGTAIPTFQTDDLSFLNSLKKLKKLALNGNRLTQLRLPEGMGQLEELNVSGNSLTEFDFPSGMTKLRDLRISRNQLRQIAFPEDMAALEILWMEFNQVESLEFSDTMKQLKQLILSDNQLTTLVLPAEASKLEWLSLRGNNFRSAIQFPENPAKPFWLDLGKSMQALRDYSFLSDLPGLTRLELIDSRFDLTTLDVPLSQLETLQLDLETGRDFILPPGYGALKDITLTATRLQKFELPEGLHQLNRIHLHSDAINEIDLPEGLIALKQFSFFGRRLHRIQLPSDMIHLEVLELSRTQIETLEIPEGVGSQASFQPQVYLYETPIRKVKVPSNWSRGIQTNRAFLRADRISFDSSGNLQLLVRGSFGTVIVEKSVDLKTWREVGRVPITNSGGTQRFRESNAFSDRNGFYRVRLQQ